MIPLNSFLSSNSAVLSPFKGAEGEYIRCGSTGGQPGWYNEADVLVPMSSTLNIYFHSAPNISELWFDTMTRSTINREFNCSTQNGSLSSLSSFIGLFFLHQNKLSEYLLSLTMFLNSHSNINYSKLLITIATFIFWLFVYSCIIAYYNNYSDTL